MKIQNSDMGRDEFIARFGGIYEHSAWIAEQLWQNGLDESHNTPEGLALAMREVLKKASDAQKLALIRAHPELAGRAAIGGKLTQSSKSEQSGAGLTSCSRAEFEQFQSLNAAYNARFGFPFIIAVKGRTRREILAEFTKRLANSPTKEFQSALEQINKIALLRLREMALPL